MLYPSITEYLSAIQSAEDNFDKLSSYRPVLDIDNNPIFSSGSCAVVFKMKDSVDSSIYAVRCFLKDTFTRKGIMPIEERIQILNSEIKKANLSYFVDYEYLPKELFVDSKGADDNEQDVVRMRWIEGASLKKYLLENRNNPSLIGKLADKFLQLCRDLRLAQIAHGDFQHDNIIIDRDGNIKLIDYDSLYTPLLGQVSDLIEGYRDYQHPSRKDNNLSTEKLDYFSELVIYTSIKLIEESPSVIQEFDMENGEGLLFSAADFKNFKNSAISKTLISKGRLFGILNQIFEEYLSEVDIQLLKAFDVRLNELCAPPDIVTFRSNRTSVYEGDSIIISWDVNNATRVFLNNEELSSFSGHQSYTLKKDMLFKIKAINGLKESVKQVKIQVLKKPHLEFSVDKHLLREGKSEKGTLSWRCENIKSVQVIEGKDKCIAEGKFSGSISVSPKVTTTYILVAKGLDGEKSFQESLHIEVAPESTITFSADRLFTMPTVPVNITWDVINGDSVELIGDVPKPGKVNQSGSLTISPMKDSKVKLRVKDKFGTKENELEIRMLPLPMIKAMMAPTPTIESEVNIGVSLNTVRADVSLPKYSDISPIPFVPTMTLPHLNTEIDIQSSPIEEIKGRQLLNGWQSIVKMTNNVLESLKDKISQHNGNK